MGLPTYLVFDCGELFTASIDWDVLTETIERFHELCGELEVTPLTNFLNASRGTVSEEEAVEIEEELGAELKGDCYYLPDGQVLWPIEDQWFIPSDGLKTTKALLTYLESNAGFWTDEEKEDFTAEAMLEVMVVLDRALERGQKAGCLFHLQCLY